MNFSKLNGKLLGSIGVSALLSGLLIAQQQPPPTQPPPNQPNQPNQPSQPKQPNPNQPNPNRPNDPNQPGKPDRPKTPANTTAMDRTPQPFRVERASQLLGKTVQTQRGERLGQIQEFAIDPDNQNRVAYAVLSQEKGAAGANQLRAVPMSSLSLEEKAGHFIFTGDAERLRSAQGFDQNQWPRMDDPTWASKTFEHYNQEPYWVDNSQPSGDPRLRIERSRDIIGRTLQSKNGESVGRIEDLAIDPDTGRVAYNIVSMGGTGSAGRYYAMPPGTVTMPRTGRTATVDFDSDRLNKAPNFEKERWPNLSDPTYASTVYDYYGQKPYWMRPPAEQSGIKTVAPPPQRNP